MERRLHSRRKLKSPYKSSNSYSVQQKTARFFLAQDGKSSMMVSVAGDTKRREPHPPKFGSLPIHQPDPWKDPPYQWYVLLPFFASWTKYLFLTGSGLKKNISSTLKKMSDYLFPLCQTHFISSKLKHTRFGSLNFGTPIHTGKWRRGCLYHERYAIQIIPPVFTSWENVRAFYWHTAISLQLI